VRLRMGTQLKVRILRRSRDRCGCFIAARWILLTASFIYSIIPTQSLVIALMRLSFDIRVMPLLGFSLSDDAIYSLVSTITRPITMPFELEYCCKYIASADHRATA
jgi:hypothetical protein